MPRVVHIEFPVDVPERASGFYSEVFGWTIEKWNGAADYWTVKTGADDRPGINGGLMRRREPSGPIPTLDVPSTDEYVERITTHGGQVVMPKLGVPGVGWLAYCQDTEGNVFGIMQADASAK